MNHRLRALLLAVLLLSGTVTLAATPNMPPPAIIVETVARHPIADRLEALGTLRANETVRITASVSDIISRINFEDGQAVEAGDVLVELTDTEESALLAEAESLADEARKQFERFEGLVARGSASESQLDERRREWRAAEARLDAVRSRLRDRLVTAPFSGRVGLRNVSPGALLSPGDPITTLVDDSRMKLDFSVPALYFASLRPGTRIEATSPVLPGETFEGTVSSVDSTIDPVTRAITVRAVLPNQEHELIAGMLMTLQVLRNERDAIVIAEEAIVPQGENEYVFVVVDADGALIAERRAVELGTRVPGRVEVLSGLSEGEQVITHGTLKVRPGMEVRIKAVDDGSRPIAELIRPDANAGRRIEVMPPA
ncbi:MAG: efflux RND transporter periplasmic adaptor subunit [Pseudomonadales bacterium]|jgi:membrane fusion protein (multidrug efflux system)